MSTAKPEPEPLAIDSLAELEERVHRTVELVADLKAERDAALADLAEAKAEAKAALACLAAARKAMTAVEDLRSETAGLRAERKQVRVRIEKLLAQMDQVAGR